MTRELKIALIVGFSAVLFVAILLSDHFAKVHKAPLLDPGTSTPSLVGIAPSDQLKTPESQVFGTEKRLALAEGVTPVADQMAKKQAERERQLIGNDPVVLDNTATKAKETTVASNLTSALEQAKQRLVNGTAPAAVSTAKQADPHADLTRQVQMAGGDIIERDGQRQVVLPDQNKLTDPAPSKLEPTKPEPTKPELARSEPTKPEATGAEPVRHLVANGESLYDIAKKYYGNGGQWKKIAEANPGRVAANGSVRTGVQLLIPNAAPKTAGKDQTKTTPGQTPAVEQKSKTTLPSETRIALDKNKKTDAKDTTKPAAKPEAKPETKTDTKAKVDPKKELKDPKLAIDSKAKHPATYTVRPGDTAGKISQQILGTSKRADEILELNNLQEESLRAGMVLKIPSV